jgi:cysteine desulfurase
LSSHKIGGPQGVGALIVRGTAPFAVRQVGGGQERGRRGGTENVAGVVGFGVAAGLATEGLAMMTTVARLRDRFEAGCLSKLPAAHVWGAAANRLPNTSCIAMPGVAAETQVMALDLAGIAVSAGAACSSGRVRSSHVLAAMGAAPPNESIRVSLGEATTEAEIDRLIAVWCGLANRRRGNVTQAVAA